MSITVTNFSLFRMADSSEWTVIEKKSFKECIRLGGINTNLIHLAVPQKSLQAVIIYS